MICYLLFVCIICNLFVLKSADPLIGENTWPTMPNQFPFIVSLRLRSPVLSDLLLNNGHYCSGSLITTKHVLTAAHCLENFNFYEIYVNIGETDLSNIGFVHDVESWITYSSWIRSLNRLTEFPINDIAIIKLTATVTQPDIKPVTITPLNNQQLYGKNAIITGWKTLNKDSIARTLHRARVKILMPEECIQKVKLITNINFTMGRNFLCSSADPYVLTTCGDSGGPVLDEKNILIGVIKATCPNQKYDWDIFAEEFKNQYKINRHLSMDYYREFIENITDLVTKPREILSFSDPLDYTSNNNKPHYKYATEVSV